MLNFLFPSPTKNQLMALAGAFQACSLVDSYARLGTVPAKQMETAIYSLLQQNPSSTEAVYGGLENLEQGLATMEELLDRPKDPHNTLVLRYVLGVLYIARKVSANPQMLERIGTGIANASRQAELFSLTHANVIANIADLYQNTISTLKFRIQVNGVAEHLQQPHIASRIRCLLFSAVRSAVLWHQLKGNRFQLIFGRSTLLGLAREMKREVQQLKQS